MARIMTSITRQVSALVAVAVLVPMALVGCGGRQQGRFVPGVEWSPTQSTAPVTLTITPKDGTTDLPISTEIGTRTSGDITEVTLIAAGGDEVAGDLRTDGSSWVPARPLAPSTTYTASVTATGEAGGTTSAETTFSTMAEPGVRTGTGLYLFDGDTYGVAMPVVVEFLTPVPEEYRGDVQRRMFVTTDPPQPGVWHWVPWGTAAFYRAPEYWRPGTVISVRIALDGHPTGEGRYGDADRGATVTIGRKLEMKVHNKSKQLSVWRDGELARKIPVSLGKASTPSSYGHMVVMSKERTTVFDTFAELGPREGYRIDISYAMRLTWGGEFIHAAPWSVADQGVRNVSHGCINMSMKNARWLFHQALVGDPVIVTGTGAALEPGNGWTAWDMSWEEFAAGSALPVPDELATD
jgi:lipoprotein-anchoring transpeptidase ErfK/SrfK